MIPHLSAFTDAQDTSQGSLVLARVHEAADCAAIAQCHVAGKGDNCRLLHPLVLGLLSYCI